MADQTYYAVSDEQRRFSLTDIPLGAYRVVVWHPYLRETGPHGVTIQLKLSTSLDVPLAPPAGRFSANQMVENPYPRSSITEEVQSAIVPTLGK